jgi:lipoyl(octanoyl) transferase
VRPSVEVRRHSAGSPWTYADLDRRQREIAAALARRHAGENAPAAGALLLSEVAPVITIGRRTPAGDLTESEAELARRGVTALRVDRGGLATSHGPGQWVIFAVDRLERLTGDSRGVRRAVEGLLEVAREVGRHYDPTAEIRAGAETGAWTARGKFASVGVHVARGVLLHGLAVNGFRTPTSFSGLRPCGLAPRVDYLLDARAPNLERAFVELGDRLRDAALRTFWNKTVPF